MPPEGLPRAGEPFYAKPMSWFCSFSISTIFNLVTANDRYKNSKEVFFSFFDRSTPRGIITNLVERIE